MDVCEYAGCVETKKGYKTVCELWERKCLNNHQDKFNCSEYREEIVRLRVIKKYG